MGQKPTVKIMQRQQHLSQRLVLNRRAGAPLLRDPISYLIGLVKRTREQELHYDRSELVQKAETVGILPLYLLSKGSDQKGRKKTKCMQVVVLKSTQNAF